MATIDIEYRKLCNKIVNERCTYLDESRGINCKQVSSYTFELNNIYKEFPLLTTKKMFTKGIVGELIWFLRGDSNIKYLVENGINIWNKDAYNWHKKMYPDTLMQQENFGKQVLSFGDNSLGDVGRNYGVQWREWTKAINKDNPYVDTSTKFGLYGRKSFDQIANLIQNLISKPMGRRHIVTAWNPAELDQTALPPCHWAFEIIPYPLTISQRLSLLPISDVDPLDETVIVNLSKIPKYAFDLKWHQRSVDTFLGLPFNITSYALLMKIIGEFTDMLPNNLIGDLSNVHFYEPHIELVTEQMKSTWDSHSAVKFDFSDRLKHYFEAYRNSELSDNGSNLDFIFNKFKIEDFEFKDYTSFDTIKAEMYEPKK